MGAFKAIWSALTSRQKLVAEIALGWVITKILDALWALLFGPAWGPIAMIFEFLRVWILNAYVGWAIFGGLVVAFWPEIVKLTRYLNILALIAIGIATFLILNLGIPALLEYLENRDNPRLFTPKEQDSRDSSGRPLVFTNLETMQFFELHKKMTSLAADQILHDEYGKWIAITGKLENAYSFAYEPAPATRYANSIQVELHQGIGETKLEFQPHWKQVISDNPRNSWIYAICKVHEYSAGLTLDECKLTGPKSN